MNKIIVSAMCVTLATQLIGEGNTSNRVSEVAAAIQYGLDNLLTQTKHKTVQNRSKYKYEFVDQNIVFTNMLEFKKISITAENQPVEIFMAPDEETGDGVTLIGYPQGKPKCKLYPENGWPIFIDILVNTEFKRLPKHNLSILKDYNITNDFQSFVQWTLVDNQRVLFSPTGYKSSSLELPEDATNHLIQGQFVDTNLELNGICLIDGIVYIVADSQDVTVKLDEYTWLMNANDTSDCVLVLLANVDRKITFLVNESMEWRSHLNAPFLVVQGGPGKIEIKIVADDND